ncbi:MAG: hypothetical protein DRI89_01625 [Bacteroidetes bacterium]|nr:MAG: hypothetical protein DRI89_01625 [Bacteroidota bacterium]
MQNPSLVNYNANLVEIHYLVVEFRKEVIKAMQGHTLEQANCKKQRNRMFKHNNADVIPVIIAFHPGGYCKLFLSIIIKKIRGAI